MAIVPHEFYQGNNKCQTRDKPLSFHWAAEGDWLPATCERLGIALPKKIDARSALGAIILDAAMEARGAGRSISYSRRRAFYAQATRYEHTAFKFSTVVPAVDALAEAGALLHEKAAVGSLGWQSRFRAAPPLLDALACDDQKLHHTPIELVRLRDRNGALVDYSDTRATERMRRNMVEINEGIASADLQIAGHEGKNIIVFPGGAVSRSKRNLYRVFSGDWASGGRLYGGWWQTLPRKKSPLRQAILIDGAPTVELDYPEHHARLLYRAMELDIDGPAYDVPGHPRDLIKRAFNTLLCASSRRASVGAVAEMLAGEGATYRAAAAQRTAAEALIVALERRHGRISAQFHNGAGLRLQRIDAEIALQVTTAMTRSGVPCLPIHDSFIVPKAAESKLSETMQAALETANFSQIFRRTA